jgi:hypothetical protein
MELARQCHSKHPQALFWQPSSAARLDPTPQFLLTILDPNADQHRWTLIRPPGTIQRLPPRVLGSAFHDLLYMSYGELA